MAIQTPRVRRCIAAMSAYVPGEKPAGADAVKLNQNENPYPPSPAVGPAVAAAFAEVRPYPDSAAEALRRTAAAVYGVPAETVMACNGSDEFLRILVHAFIGPGDEVVAFNPGYTYYKTLADMYDARYRTIEFTPDYRLPERLDLAGAKLVFLPNPNAPSGTRYSRAEILRLADAAPCALVCVDEAYIDFAGGGTTSLPLVSERRNVAVARTFSKGYGLAGLRVGLGFAAPEIMADLEKVRDYYNVDVMAQAGAEAALRDQAYLAATVAKVVATRERLAAELTAMGYYVWPSATNFVLARVPGGAEEARRRFAALRERNIYVRYFPRPRVDDCLRISVGTDAETDRLLTALREIGG